MLSFDVIRTVESSGKLLGHIPAQPTMVYMQFSSITFGPGLNKINDHFCQFDWPICIYIYICIGKPHSSRRLATVF